MINEDLNGSIAEKQNQISLSHLYYHKCTIISVIYTIPKFAEPYKFFMPIFNSDEIGSGDTSALAGNYWQEAGSNEFNSQNVGFSASGTDECQQFSDCQHFRTFYEPLPLVLPSVAGSVNSCSFVQPGDGTVWTGQAAETGRGMTVECIQAGEAPFSLGQPSTSSEDLSDEIVSFLAFLSTFIPTCWYGVHITKCACKKLLEVVIKTWKLSL